MRENDALPDVQVDPDTFTVTIDGDVVEPGARRRTAHGPALLPLLTGRHHMSRAALLVLADGRFPAGGHAHSGGAEAAVKAGRIRDAADLAEFCRGRLHTAGLTSAALAAAAAAGLDPLALDEAADARTPSPALRATARKLGPPDDAGGPGDLAVAPNSTRWPPRGRAARTSRSSSASPPARRGSGPKTRRTAWRTRRSAGPPRRSYGC